MNLKCQAKTLSRLFCHLVRGGGGCLVGLRNWTGLLSWFKAHSNNSNSEADMQVSQVAV